MRCGPRARRRRGDRPGRRDAVAARAAGRPGPRRRHVGTGGDRANTVNISTMAALVAAGAGRGWSSTATGRRRRRAAPPTCSKSWAWSSTSRPRRRSAVDEAGIGFCFAPVFHAGLRHAGDPRRELGVPTVFNFLGPLTNPARPSARPSAAPTRGWRRSWPRCSPPVATGAGLPRRRRAGRVTTTTTSRSGWGRGTVRRSTLDPARLGIARAAPEALRGGDPTTTPRWPATCSAAAREPAVRDVVLLNAAAAVAFGTVWARGRLRRSGSPPHWTSPGTRSTRVPRRRCWPGGRSGPVKRARPTE